MPTNYDPAHTYPLFVLLHEHWAQADVFMKATKFDELAEKRRFVVIAPSIGSGWMAEGVTHRVEDIVRITAASLCIDEKRIFVVGQAAGGKFAERSTCLDWVAGAASHATARAADDHLIHCEPVAPYISFRGLQSRHEPFDGREPCGSATRQKSVEEMEAEWGRRSQCEGPRKPWARDGNTRCWTWGCRVPYVSCHVDGGHAWPNTKRRRVDLRGCDGPLADYPIEERILDFFGVD